MSMRSLREFSWGWKKARSSITPRFQHLIPKACWALGTNEWGTEMKYPWLKVWRALSSPSHRTWCETVSDPGEVRAAHTFLTPHLSPECISSRSPAGWANSGTFPSRALPALWQVPQNLCEALQFQQQGTYKGKTKYFTASFVLACKEKAIGRHLVCRELGIEPKLCCFNHGRNSFSVFEAPASACSQLPFNSVCKAVSPHSCTESQKAFFSVQQRFL